MKGFLMIMLAVLAVASAAPSGWRPLAEDILPERMYRPEHLTRDVSGIPLVDNSPFDPVKFREFMANYSECMGFYGGAVSIVRGGQTIFAEGFGWCNANGTVKCTNKTAFGVASVSKSFTGMLGGIMQNEGKLHLDNRVSDYIPGFKLQDPIASEEVRLVDLLCHRTGLPRHDDALLDNPMTREELAFAARYLPPSAAFREKWQYSNWMFVVAGYAMEAVTGHTWERLLREKVLEPLGMTHSYVNFAEAIAAHDEFMSEAVYPIGKGVYMNFMPVMSSFDNIGPAGTVCSDAIEFAKYMNAHLRHAPDIVSSSVLNLIHTATMTTPMSAEFGDKDSNIFAQFAGTTYGYGLMHGSYKGHRTIQHKGYNSIFFLFPDDDIGIFVTSTGGTGQEMYREILIQYLADSVMGLTPSFKTSDDVCNYPCSLYPTLGMCNHPEEPSSSPPPPVHQTKTTPEMFEYVGTYKHPAYGVMNISYTLNEPYLGVAYKSLSPDLSNLRATPYVADTFGLSTEYPGYENQNYSQITFFRNLDRKVVGYSWHVVGQPAIMFTNPNFEPVSLGYGYTYATSTVYMPSSEPGPKGEQGAVGPRGSAGAKGQEGAAANALYTYIIGALAAVGLGLAGFVVMTANKAKRSEKLLGDSGTQFVPLLK